jgi:hypothetical protein
MIVRKAGFRLPAFAALMAGAIVAAHPAAAEPAALPAAALALRSEVVAISLAEAASPAARALAAPQAATSRAYAQMQPIRRVRTASAERLIERRVRMHRDPFFLAVGVAY